MSESQDLQQLSPPTQHPKSHCAVPAQGRGMSKTERGQESFVHDHEEQKAIRKAQEGGVQPESMSGRRAASFLHPRPIHPISAPHLFLEKGPFLLFCKMSDF